MMTAGAVPSRVIVLAPTAVLTLLALIALQLTPLLGSPGALGFLLAGGWLILRQPRQALAEVQHAAWLIALAGWALLSVVWSDYPMATLRYGVLLLFTFAVGIAMASRLAPLTFLKAVCAAYAFAGAASLAIGRDRPDGMGFLGIFNSKNAMSGAASILLLAALAIVLDRSLPRGLRLMALGATAMAGVLLVRSQSMGAFLAAAAGVAVLLALPVLARIGARGRFVGMLLGLLLFILAAGAILANLAPLSAWFTETSGKDLTLTGRTDLWAVALQEIARRPLTGTGYQAFWVAGQPLAESLWQQFGISTRIGFHFHNVLLSNAVEIGLPAAVAQMAAVIWAYGVVLIWAVRVPRAETMFLAALLTRQMLLSLSEVTFFIQFDLPSILTVAAIVYARRYRRAAP